MEQIQSTYIVAPFIMMYVSPGVYLAILIVGSLIEKDFFETSVWIFAIAIAVSIPASLIIGYIFIGIIFLIHKFFLKIKVIQD